jgi:hypothetical protein
MTLKFLTEFRARTTCGYCKRAPAEGRRTCPIHLEKAKFQFRKWAKLRVAKGLCLNCDRRGYQGECRCLLHKGVNQERCRMWSRVNSDWLAFKSAFERFWFKIDGICRYCRRVKLAKGSVAGCRSCLDRHRTHGGRGLQLARAA